MLVSTFSLVATSLALATTSVSPNFIQTFKIDRYRKIDRKKERKIDR